MERTLVDFRMQEWRMGEQSPRIQDSVRKVLSELDAEALMCLKDPRFEVMVLPGPDFSVWAYFPVHRRRCIARKVHPKARTRVLLVFSTAECGKIPVKLLKDQIRDHLGHVLLYLRSPRAPNNCPDAWKEWQMSIRRKARAKKAAKGV
jgi:hypothetical protein